MFAFSFVNIWLVETFLLRGFFCLCRGNCFSSFVGLTISGTLVSSRLVWCFCWGNWFFAFVDFSFLEMVVPSEITLSSVWITEGVCLRLECVLF